MLELQIKPLTDQKLERITIERQDLAELGRWMERGYSVANPVLYILDDDNEEKCAQVLIDEIF